MRGALQNAKAKKEPGLSVRCVGIYRRPVELLNF